MYAVILTGHGDLDQLSWRTDWPEPKPGNGEVLIEVAAAGVNNTDINTRVGWYSRSDSAEDATWGGQALSFPRIQGIDVCGTIVEVGAGVDASRKGERVLVEPCLRVETGNDRAAEYHFLGSELDGGFAQYCVVPARYAHRVQSEYSSIELASFPCSYSTAENMLSRAQASAGERVLITGASGGVGSAAVQLARMRGCEITAVCAPAKVNDLLELGAQRCWARGQSLLELTSENSFDVVVDLVGGPSWPELLKLLRPGGRYAVAGAVAGAEVKLDLRDLYLKDLTLYGCTVLGPQVFSDLVRAIESGSIKPLVAATWPLAHIVQAQQQFLQKRYTGKIVLDCSAQAQPA